jgi:exopolysaccharide biosynthesis polyprenyl glycosylphosphotransferase
MSGFPALRQLGHETLAVAAMVVCVAALTGWQKLYRLRVCEVRSLEISGLLRVSALSGLAAVGLAGTVGLHLPWRWAAFGASVGFALDSAGRGVFTRWLRAARASGRYCHNVVIVGDNDEAADLHNLTEHHPESGLRVVGVVGCPGGYPSPRLELPWLGTIDDLPNAVDCVDSVIVATSAFSNVELNRAIRVLLEADVHIQLSTGLTGINYRRLRPLPLARQPMFYVEQHRPSGIQMFAKRALDLVMASTMLLLTAPILAVAALAVKRDDRKASIIYRQERVGKGGRPFTVYKLRTMVPDAATRLEEVRALNQRTGPLFKLAADPRITHIGSFLRQTSIDELPQLVNVLKGEMSLVGPRPALPAEVAEFDPAHRARENVTPGVTGLWQVEARNNPSFFAYRNLDLFYVENWSLLLDLAIITSTVAVVAGGALRAIRSRLRPAARGSVVNDLL